MSQAVTYSNFCRVEIL